MRLMDLLTEADKNKLQGMARKTKKHKKANYNYSKNSKANAKDNVDNKNKSKIRVNNATQIKRKKRYIKECPYCASIELYITPNGYYYCNNCGFKIEKI